MNRDNFPLDKKIEITITSGRTFDPKVRNLAMLFSNDRECHFEDEPSNHDTTLGLQIALGSMDAVDRKYNARKLAEAFENTYYIQKDCGYSSSDIFKMINTPEEFSLFLYNPMGYFISKDSCREISKEDIPTDSKFYSAFK